MSLAFRGAPTRRLASAIATAALGAALAIAELPATASPATVVVLSSPGDPVLDFTSSELRHWVAAASATSGARTHVTFRLRVRSSMQPFTFAVSAAHREQETVVFLDGFNASAVRDAAFTALDQMGYRFDVLAPAPPRRLRIDRLPTHRVVYSPAVQRRGVRLHVNFAMDISSYPLAEATAYVRSLARMRYNWITFHSYPGHWTREKWSNNASFGVYQDWMRTRLHPKANDLVTGAFFYGDHFPVPNYPPIRKVVRFNRSIYCMPEVEPYYYTIEQRGHIMTRWLAAVMRECKRVGMGVQLSTEIRGADETYNAGLMDRIEHDYPMLDGIELISREGGDEVKGDFSLFYDAQRALFKEIVDAPTGADVDRLVTTAGRSLDDQTKDLAFNIRLARQLRARHWDSAHKIRLAVGNYACSRATVRLAVRLANEFVPEGVWYTLMPGHSSREAADLLDTSEISPSLLGRSVIYSWIEFDGFMFSQQFASSGIQNALNTIRARTGGRPVFAFLCNHWRTGENFLSFRYLNAAAMRPEMTPDVFLRDWAADAHIAAAPFIRVMTDIDRWSDIRSNAGNVAFPLKDVWQVDPRRRTIGSIWWWSKETQAAEARSYDSSADVLADLARQSNVPAYRRRLELLSNRCRAAACHFGAIRLLQDACIRFDREKQRMPDELTDLERALVRTRCDQAQPLIVRYIDLLAALPVDRGVEGTLVNYYYCMPMLCNNIRAIYGGEGKFIQIDTDDATVPLPLNEGDRTH